MVGLVEYVTAHTRPVCGHPVADDLCGTPAMHFLTIRYGLDYRRIYRCAEHGDRVPADGCLVDTGRVLVLPEVP